jgi:ABC-2 type transport system permease protein
MPIFDQGYQNWNGPLSGHGTRWWAVTRHGVRGLLKSWIVRVLLLVAWLPAIALVVALALWGLLENQAQSIIQFLSQSKLLPAELIDRPHEFRAAAWTIAYSYFFKAELYYSLLLVLVVGPNLVSRDLRFNALPLYLSRPLRRFDYFAGKLGVIAFFLFLTTVGPAVGAYLLGLAFSRDLGVVRDTHQILWGGILYGTVVTMSAGTLMLALSSLSRRSIYVGLTWAGLVFLSSMISQALTEARYDAERRAIVHGGIREWVKENPPPPGQEMYGSHPKWPYNPNPKKDEKPSDEEKARDAWRQKWSRQYAEFESQARASRNAQAATDWRPLLSYATNLDRLGDTFLGTDAAWVLIGRTVERPRALVKGPMAGRVSAFRDASNERSLANDMVWQYPWYWSGGVLAGVWLVSVFVLSRRVKSLDRLK